jgi:TP901 family phage tail tape measure protein
MASKKEFEVLFALNARMNGGFSGTFSKAQAEFTRLGKEIQSLHRVQGDIASWQKQQSAIEATRSKLESLQKQHDLLQREIKETEGSTAGLEREKVKLEQRIKDTEAALERQNQKLETTGEKLKKAGVNTNDLTEESARLAGQLKELEAAQDDAAKGAASFGERSVQAFEAAGQALAAAGIAEAMREIAQAYLECVGVAADFQETMSGVEAISGATAEEMALLSAKAKDLGADTKFTAKEAGDAMGYMAMAGWKARDMLSGLEGVMNLAAASGEDLAATSDIVTDALTAFGMTAADSGRFADILAVAASNANTNVAMMGETFKYVAPVAGALGYSAEDTALAIGLMANSGIKASQAGTTLRSVITRLSTDAGASKTQLGALGVLTERLGVAFYNADGSARAMRDVIADCREAWAGLSKEQQISYAKTIAGQEAMSGWLALMNATQADVQKLAVSVDNCAGAAERMAKIRLDNLNGQLTLMNSAWDALRVTIGEQFNPELRKAAELGTDVLGWLDEFVRENPALVKGVMTFAGVMGTATVAVTGVNAALKVFQALNVAALFTGPAGAILGGAAAVAGLTAAVVGLVTAANEGVPTVRELTEAARDMQGAMDEAGAAYEETATQTMAAAEVAGLYINKLEELETAEGRNAAQNQEYQNTLALLLRAMPELSDCISQTTDEYGRSAYALETDTKTLRDNTEELKKNAQARAYQEYLNKLYDEYGAVLLESAENSVKLTQAQTRLDTAEKNQSDTMARMNELLDESLENGTALSSEYYELQKTLYGYDKEIDTASREINNLNAAMEDDAQAAAEAEAALSSAAKVVEQLTGATKEQTAAAEEAASQNRELQDVISGVATRVSALTEAYEEAYTAALESVSGQYALWDEAAAVVATSAGSINSALESQITYWQDYNANLRALAERSTDVEGLSAVLASFADGSAESANAVAGLANATDEELRDMVANWQELQEEQEAAAGSIADLKTNFTNTMDELQAELAEDIAAMDLGEEAAASGRATIQGYIDAMDEMLPQVEAACKSLARAASKALGPAPYSDSAYAAGRTERGYASGTSNAQPGWAMVGENGPEMMFFHGGETVLNAAQTSARLAKSAPAGGSSGPVNINFQIQGSATPETVQDLRSFADQIVSTVMTALDGAREDERRGSY